jgi:hypothetical protein
MDTNSQDVGWFVSTTGGGMLLKCQAGSYPNAYVKTEDSSACDTLYVWDYRCITVTVFVVEMAMGGIAYTRHEQRQHQVVKEMASLMKWNDLLSRPTLQIPHRPCGISPAF